MTAETGVLRAKVRGRSTMTAPGSATTPAVPRRLNLEGGGGGGGRGDGGDVNSASVKTGGDFGRDAFSDASRGGGFSSGEVSRHALETEEIPSTSTGVSPINVKINGGGGGGSAEEENAATDLDAAHAAQIDAAIRASMGEDVPEWATATARAVSSAESEEERAVKLAIEMSLADAKGESRGDDPMDDDSGGVGGGGGGGGDGVDGATAIEPVHETAATVGRTAAATPAAAARLTTAAAGREDGAAGAGIGTEVGEDEEDAAVDEATAAVRVYPDDTSPSGPDVAALGGSYRLHGVISHLGSSPECGHYVAHVADRPTDKGGWTTYDDEDVKEVWPSAVLGMAQERQCYVAVYVLD